MISANNTVKNILNQNTTVKMIGGMRFEYNMNEYGEVITDATISNFDGQDYEPVSGVSGLPFKKLFPIDTIKKPLRPESAGIKYAIIGDITSNTWKDPKNIDYPLTYRTYYPGEDTYYKYWVSGKNNTIKINIKYWSNTAKTTGLTIPVNKIVAKFEVGHTVPTSWTVKTKLNNSDVGQTATSTTLGAVNSTTGVLNLYWTGTAWSTNESDLNRSSYISCNQIELVAVPASQKYVGVIEFSPRYEIDVSDRLVDFSISKETSSAIEDLVPVGKITSNSLTFNAVSYENNILFKTFDSSIATIDPAKIYLSENLIIKPYFKVYEGPSSPNSHEVKQGVFYLKEWRVSEYGDLNAIALDASKLLQETIVPRILLKEFSSPGIIRNILDSIGFTNYKFNYKRQSYPSGAIEDSSLITPNYWWSETNESVWEALEKLCRDSQMVACVDENNILQFYTREFLFDTSKTVDWAFRYSADGSNLPNIMSLEKTEQAMSRKVKVIWSPAYTSEYDDLSAQPLWQSGQDVLGAGALNKTLPASQTTGYVTLVDIPVSVNDKSNLIFSSYSGYFAIGSEIIEYDAVRHMYIKDSDGSTQYVDIQNSSEFSKHKGLARPQNIKERMSYLIPTGEFRIKTRGALGTTSQIKTHSVEPAIILGSWEGRSVTFGPTSDSTEDESIVSLTGQINLAVVPPDPIAVLTPPEDPLSEAFYDYMYHINVMNLSNSSSKTINNALIKSSQSSVSVPETQPNSLVIATMGDKQITRSILSISNNNKNKNNHSLIYKDLQFATSFTSQVTASIISVDGEPQITTEAQTEIYNHFAFGTTLFFDNSSDAPRQSGGIGFLVSNNGLTGYYVLISNVQESIASKEDKFVRILKVTNGTVKVLEDNQNSPSTRASGIFPGQTHRVDIKLKKILNGSNQHTANQIIVYINGYKIVASDSSSPISINTNVALLTNEGKTSFDYVYAGPIKQEEYNNSGAFNVYSGKYGITTLSFLYGERTINSLGSERLFALEEFGPSARELKKVKALYNSGNPGIPAYLTTGVNKVANILATKTTNFGFEAYVINNAGTFTTLAGSNGKSFAMFGKSVIQDSSVEYNTDPENKYKLDKPVIFDSTWIQKESDATELAGWIKNQWSEKQMTVDMQVFSNPLISVGDIITINYPRTEINSTMKFLVTNVNLDYKEGLDTSITCRRILAG